MHQNLISGFHNLCLHEVKASKRPFIMQPKSQQSFFNLKLTIILSKFYIKGCIIKKAFSASMTIGLSLLRTPDFSPSRQVSIRGGEHKLIQTHPYTCKILGIKLGIVRNAPIKVIFFVFVQCTICVFSHTVRTRKCVICDRLILWTLKYVGLVGNFVALLDYDARI